MTPPIQVLDLTHPLHPDMPVFPGTEKPCFETPLTIEANGFEERRLTMFSHTGTHMDAPCHILPGAASLDELPPETFVGPAHVVDASGCTGTIGADVIREHEDALRGADFLLLRTGWDRYWGDEKFYSGFPALTEDAARLVAGCGLKGIGTDAISIDVIESTGFEIHRILLGAGMIVVENLLGLERLADKKFTFLCAPLRISGGDGSPVRALAVVE